MLVRFICLILLTNVAVFAQERVIQLPPTWPSDGRVPTRLKEQYVFLGPKQDTLIVRMPVEENDLNGPLGVVTIPLHNNLHPSVRVTISSPKPGLFRYDYTISNSSKAEDRIGTWALVVPPEDEVFDMTHAETHEHQGWSGKTRSIMSRAPRVGLPGWPPGCIARWYSQEKSQLVTPGSSVGGFEISSANKPGLTTAFFASDIPPPFELLQGSPAALQGQMEFYNKDPAWRDCPRVIIGPRFSANTPEIDILKDFY